VVKAVKAVAWGAAGNFGCWRLREKVVKAVKVVAGGGASTGFTAFTAFIRPLGAAKFE
jgi:hypothetical protein